MDISLHNPALEWVPNIQSTQLLEMAPEGANPQRGLFPVRDHREDAVDQLKNDGDTPLIVRQLRVGITRNIGTGLTLEIYHNKHGGDLVSMGNNPIGRSPDNSIEYNRSSPTDTKRLTWELAKPFLLLRGEALRIDIGVSFGIDTYNFVSNAADLYFLFDVVGVESGKHHRWGSGTTATFTKLTKSFRNVYREDVYVLGLSVWVGAENYYLADIRVSNGIRWTRSERPVWSAGYTSDGTRYDFSGLPAGGVVFQPGEYFSGRFKNLSIPGDGEVIGYQTRLTWEAYQLRTTL